MPGVKEVEAGAFSNCPNLINAKFGKDLESIGVSAFDCCRSLERITLPLKHYSCYWANNIFERCQNLNHVDLVEGVQETIDTLIMKEWRNDLNNEIGTINRILPNIHAGNGSRRGGKAKFIRNWMKKVHPKYTHYKAEHRRYLNVTAALEPVLSKDIVLNNVLPFLSKSFAREEGE